MNDGRVNAENYSRMKKRVVFLARFIAAVPKRTTQRRPAFLESRIISFHRSEMFRMKYGKEYRTLQQSWPAFISKRLGIEGKHYSKTSIIGIIYAQLDIIHKGALLATQSRTFNIKICNVIITQFLYYTNLEASCSRKC